MPVRILKYSTAIIEIAMQDMNNINQHTRMPSVIPIVIYTGKKKWDVEQKLQDTQEQIYPFNKIALGQYNLIDVNTLDNNMLLKDDLFISKMFLLEKSRNKEQLLDNLEKIIEVEEKEKNLNFLKKLIQLIFSEKLEEKEIQEILEKIKEKGEGKMFLDILEREEKKMYRKGLKEGIGQGISQGIAEGINQGMEKVIIQMLKNNFTDQMIIKITNITKQRLEDIKKKCG